MATLTPDDLRTLLLDVAIHPRRVFNTGSWMPQLDVTGLPLPTLDDLDRLEYTGHELRFLAIELGDPPRAQLLPV